MHNWGYQSKDINKNLGGINISEVKNVTINDIATIDKPLDSCMLFLTTSKWEESHIQKLEGIKDSFIIIEKGAKDKLLDIAKRNHIVVTENSRLYFAKALIKITKAKEQIRSYKTLDNNIVIGENAIIGEGCRFEPLTFIDNDVIIGNNVLIKAGAKIRQNVKIGNNVTIGENSVIGVQGFGIEKDEDLGNLRMPHIGGVEIGNNVEIGTLTSIVSGTINPTIIGDNCFVDDLSHIAHNCEIGSGTLVTACAQVSGSAKIGQNGYISPNVTIKNGVVLGNNCFVGQASSVQKNYGDNMSLVGNPAREFNNGKEK